MKTINRKVRYRLYPSAKQERQMLEMLRLHQRLYNSALEQRLDAYKRCHKSLSFNDQCAELTRLRIECPEYASLNAQSEQVTLKRLDRAFKGFYLRLHSGEAKAGFPRFKAFDRFKGWGYKSHGDGWKLISLNCESHICLRLSGVGNLQARGRGRFIDKERTSRDPGTPKTMEILRKNDKWYASVTYETFPGFRASGEKAIGLDWGTAKFLTIVSDAKDILLVGNPRHLKKCEDSLRQAQRRLARKKHGSKNRLKAKKILLDRYERLTFKREDFLHQTSARLVAGARFIATEALNIKGMTASGSRYKASLNRPILDTSPGTFFQMLAYKAADAGIPYVEVPTKKIKPSQTCSKCAHQEKKPLFERVHRCTQCRLVLDRDVNAARVILNYALTGKVTGQELSLDVESGVTCSMKHETPSISEQTCQGL